MCILALWPRNDYPYHPAIFRWWKKYQRESFTFVDDERTGRFQMSVREKNDDNVRKILE